MANGAEARHADDEEQRRRGQRQRLHTVQTSMMNHLMVQNNILTQTERRITLDADDADIEPCLDDGQRHQQPAGVPPPGLGDDEAQRQQAHGQQRGRGRQTGVLPRIVPAAACAYGRK